LLHAFVENGGLATAKSNVIKLSPFLKYGVDRGQSGLMADWGVDALLQIQTRQHKDVDIVVCVADVPKLRELLSERGFSFKGGNPPNSFVLSDGAGLEIDIHAVAFNSTGQSDQPVRGFGEFSGWQIPSPSVVRV